jgi:hypothetical protein
MPLRDAVRPILLLAGGIAIVAAAVVHGVVNVPHLREDMLELGIRRTLILAISLVLYFSVVAMFGFAALVLGAATSLLRGNVPSPAPLWVVAGTYVTFGIAAFVAVSPSPHFLGYAAMGALVAVGAGLPGRVARPAPQERTSQIG